MGKTVEEICNEIINNRGEKLPKFKRTSRNLSNCLNCNNPNNPYGNIALYSYEGLYDRLERMIVEKLASAIDKNSAYDIKMLKDEYGHFKEFASAKNYLNRKCKEIWNVYTPLKDVPKDAMKALGISNCPDLDSLLYSCLKFFESENKMMTVNAISSILNNDNMPYNMDEIHKYLEMMHKTRAIKYNFNTVKYLISEHNYDKEKLETLGVEKETLDMALKDLPLKIRLKFMFKK